MKGRDFERVVCPGCHRQISAYVALGDEGRGLTLVAHNREPARRFDVCPASARPIVLEHGAWRIAS